MSVKAKEAIKIGLAMVLAYGVGMSQGWLNPVWAAIAVAMISLPTAGQSLNKGVLRMGGTLLAWVIGLFYLGLFPQDRWLTLLSFSPVLFFLTYKMTGKDGQYFWFVAAFVSMMILQQLPHGAENAFEFATFRALETLVGIVIWTLVSVFIWPRSNRGALEGISSKLLATQRSRMSHCQALMLDDGDDLQSGRGQESALVTQLGQTLAAAASEFYAVKQVRPLWQRFHGLSATLMQVSDRLQVSAPDLARIDLSRVLPDLPAFFSEMDARLTEAQNIIEGSPPARQPVAVNLPTDGANLATLNHFQQASVAVARSELQQIDELTRAMLHCVAGIKGFADNPTVSENAAAPDPAVGPLGLPPLDPDRVRASVMVVLSMWSATLVYIYVNPPGHISWFQFVPNMVMIAAQNPQMRFALFKPFAIAYPAVLLVYVFVLPQLSVFWQLGLVIFALSFVAAYFFAGLARIALYLGMFNMLGIQNQQTYDFAAMANTLLFTMMALAFVYLLTYITRSSRQEKAFLIMLRRFFRSSEFLVGQLGATRRRVSFLQRMRLAYHRQQVRSLPAKLGAWGKQIDRHKFPANSQEQVARLVASLQVVAYRIEDLIAAYSASPADTLIKPLQRDIKDWRLAIEQGFKGVAERPDFNAGGQLQNRVLAKLQKLDVRISAEINKADAENQFSEAERLRFYHLLGAFRSLSQAAVAYVGQAGNINWNQWREERF